MSGSMDRREFVKRTTAAGMGIGMIGMPGVLRHRGTADIVSVAVMGVNSRGRTLAESFAASTGSRVIAICDVDSRATDQTVATVAERQGHAPIGLTDFRRTLDDPNVDAIVIAAPDHWHTPAAIMALQAGKHVYLEKPCSHNPREGELLVEAEAKYGRDPPPPTVPRRVLVQSSLALGVRTPESREIQERMIRPDRLWGWWSIAQ